MLLKLAWRNCWRNRRRTIITVLALGLGVMAIIVMHSFRELANEEMFRSITRGLIGHAQVHGRGYQETPDLSTLVRQPAQVEERLSRALPAARFEQRVLGAGLAGARETTLPATIMGFEAADPATQSLLTLRQGRMLAAAPAQEAVIGTGLAAELDLVPGNELILVGQAADGSLANDRYTVVGTADAGSSEANATAVFLHLADAQTFFALEEGVHQVIVRLPFDQEDLREPVALLRNALDPQALEVLAWTEILPELKGAVDAKRKNFRLLDGIIFLIVSLGVLNTMTMSTFERTREFGVLRSLGTRRGRILGMVALEALLQGLVGFLGGLGLAALFLYGLGTVSFEGLAGGMDVLGARMPETLRLSIHVPAVGTAAVITLLTMLAGGLLPAVRAARLQPVEATRYV